MGTEDPMLYFDEPTYLDMLTEGQPLYLEANPWDPNDGCELDGVAWDCSDIVRQAEYGTVVGAIVVGGQLLKGQVSLQHALNFTGGGWLSVFIPGQDVEFGYDDPDPFKSHTFTLPDQWETIYIQRGGPNAPDFIDASVSGEVETQTTYRNKNNEIPSNGPSIDPKKLKNLEKALDECTRDLFQVKVTSFRASERGKAGNVSFNFTDPNRRSDAGLMGFGVLNDVTSYSFETAPEDVKNQQGKNQRVTGFTNSGSPHVNYTLSNVTNWLDIVKTQIHELGHSLQYLTRNAVGGFPQYDEAGWKLENCVRDKGGFK